jgi:HPt (histidine-containing phosphotransfer) domain-containing protein
MSRKSEPRSSRIRKTMSKTGSAQPSPVPATFAAKDIAELTSRVAKDNVRVSRFMESLVNHVDLIVDAASAQDWQEVARQADYLAGSGASHGCTELADRAAELSATLKTMDAKEGIRRQVVRLVGTCGRVRQSDAK